jgi:hypothetical protein
MASAQSLRRLHFASADTAPKKTPTPEKQLPIFASAERPVPRARFHCGPREPACRIGEPELAGASSATYVARNYDEAFAEMHQHEQYTRLVRQAVARFNPSPGGPGRPGQRSDPRYPAGEHSRFGGGPASGLPECL